MVLSLLFDFKFLKSQENNKVSSTKDTWRGGCHQVKLLRSIFREKARWSTEEGVGITSFWTPHEALSQCSLTWCAAQGHGGHVKETERNSEVSWGTEIEI